MYKLSKQAVEEYSIECKSKRTIKLIRTLENVLGDEYELDDGTCCRGYELNTKTKAKMWEESGFLVKVQKEDPYEILNLEKKKTIFGANYFNIEVMSKETGEIIRCKYFGNTTPSRVRKIISKNTDEGTYLIAIIQPHTPRDQKTGKFISDKQARRAKAEV